MPYRSTGIIISGTRYDRRQKLTPEQRVEIFHRYHTEKLSQRQLAREYGVSRRLVTFIVNPENEKRNRKLLNERKAKGCTSPTGKNTRRLSVNTGATSRSCIKKVKFN